MIHIKNLKKSYAPAKEVLKGLDLDVQKGEVLGFVGSNGAGKTTTLRILTCSLAKDEGEIQINQHGLAEGISYKQQFFFIPDTIHLFPNVSGEEWLYFIFQLYKCPVTDLRSHPIVVGFEMEEAITQVTAAYSYGMLHKLMLIAAFIIQPPVLMMDEPLNGLDPEAIVTFKKYMKTYVANGGTLLFSTHLLDIAEKMCTHVAFLKNGKIVLHDKVSHLTEKQSLEDLFMEVVEDEE